MKTPARLWALLAGILIILPAAAAPVPRVSFGVELSFAQPFPGDLEDSLQLKVSREGIPVAYHLLLANRGEVNDTYDIFSAGTPPGWTAVLNATVVSIAPYSSTQLSLAVTPPSSLSAGLRSWALLTVWARSRYDPTCSTHLHMLTVLNTTVNPALVVFAGPGQKARSVLSVRNTGSENDTMAMGAAYVHHEPNPVTHEPQSSHAPAPWTYTLNLSDMRLAPGAAGNATLTVQAPADAIEGDYLLLDITARSGQDSSKSSIITVLAVVSFRFGVRLECDVPVKKVLGGETARFSINVTNTGTMRDAISLRRTDPPAGWAASLGALSVVLDAGERRTVELDVSPPADAPPNSTGPVNVTGISAGNSSKMDGLETITIANPDILLRFNTTGMVHYVDPGNTTTFVAEVRNLGWTADTAIFEMEGEPGNWSATLEPAVLPLPPKATGSVLLNVTAPAAALAGEKKELTIRCRSQGDPQYMEEAVTRTIVNRTRDLTAEMVPHSVLAIPEQGAPFTLVVTNGGNGDEMVSFEPGRVPTNWVMEFNQSGMVLPPHSSGSVICTVTPDFASPAGNYSVVAAVSSEQARLEPEGIVQVERAFRFSLSSVPEELSVPPGGAGEFNITVSNRGNTDDAVGLELLSGKPPVLNWTLDRSTAPLPMRGSASFSARLQAPSVAPGGTRDDLRLRATSAGNSSYWKEVPLAGIVAQLHSLGLSSSPRWREVFPAESASFEVDVRDTGNMPEDVTAGDIVAPHGWACSLLDENGSTVSVLSILAMQARKLTFRATPPSGAPACNHTVEVNFSTDSGLSYALRFDVRVLQLHDFRLVPERSSIVIRAGSAQSLKISVQNLGNGPDEVSMTVNGSAGEGWAGLDASPVSVGLNGTAGAAVSLKPPAGLRAGIHLFRITGAAADGTIRNATIEVRIIPREIGTSTDSSCYVFPLLMVIAGAAMAAIFWRARRRGNR